MGARSYPHTRFFSIFVALIFIPYIRWLKREGILGELSILLVNLLFACIIAIFSIIVVKGTIEFGSKIPYLPK